MINKMMSSLVIVEVPEFSKHVLCFEAENSFTVPNWNPSLRHSQFFFLLFPTHFFCSRRFIFLSCLNRQINLILGPASLYFLVYREEKPQLVYQEGFVLLILQLWYVPLSIFFFLINSLFFSVQLLCIRESRILACVSEGVYCFFYRFFFDFFFFHCLMRFRGRIFRWVICRFDKMVFLFFFVANQS